MDQRPELGGEGEQQREGEVPVRAAVPMADVLAAARPRQAAPKFEGNLTYDQWAFQFKLWAKTSGLWACYTQAPGEAPAAAEALAERNARLYQAYADLLMALMSKQVLVQMLQMYDEVDARPAAGGAPAVVAAAARPHEAWQRLEVYHAESRMTTRKNLEMELRQLAMKQKESLEEYWTRAATLRHSYQQVGGVYSDESFMEQILLGLPATPTWGMFRTVITALRQSMAEQNPPVLMTLDQLRGRLRMESDMQRNVVQQQSLLGDVNWTQGYGGGSGRSGGSRARGRDQLRGRGEAPTPKVVGRDGRWGELGLAPKGHCHGCNQSGHRFQECKHPGKPYPSAIPQCLQDRGKGHNKGARQDRGGRVRGGSSGGKAKVHWGQNGQQEMLSDGDDDSTPASTPTHPISGKTFLVAACSLASGAGSQSWLLDSGATHHFSPYRSDFYGALEAPLAKQVRVGDDARLEIEGMGNVVARTHTGELVTITKVHYCPALGSRLLSVGQMQRAYDIVHTQGTGQAEVRCPRTHEVHLRGQQFQGEHGLYLMELTTIPGAEVPAADSKAQALSAHQQREQQVRRAQGSTAHVVEAKEVRPAHSVVADGAGSAPGVIAAAEGVAALTQLELVHRRLGHVNQQTLLRMAAQGAALGVGLTGKETAELACESCLVGKQHRQSFPSVAGSKATQPLDVVHIDVWGPVRVGTLGGRCTYVLSLLDDYSSYVWVEFLRDKSSLSVSTAIAGWLTRVERQAGRKLVEFRHDNGTEFEGETAELFERLGISRQRTSRYSPQQNGRVERWHRTMAEAVRAQLLYSGLPTYMWGEALHYFVWVKNRTPHSALPGCTSPYQLWARRKPDLSRARVFGCMGSVLKGDKEINAQGKLQGRGQMCVCVGVDPETKGWRMLDPSRRVIIVSAHVDFLEHLSWKDWRSGRKGEWELSLGLPEDILSLLPSPPVSNEEQQQAPPATAAGQQEVQDPQDADGAPLVYPGAGHMGGAPVLQEDEDPEEPGVQQQQQQQNQKKPSIPLRRSARLAARQPLAQARYAVLLEQLDHELGLEGALAEQPEEVLAQVFAAAAATPISHTLPSSAAEALQGPDAHLWRQAIDAEMQAMVQFGVWDEEPVELPPGKKAVDSKLVFRIKTNQWGEVEKYKARFVARGFSQRPGEDYHETFSSVTKMGTVRLLLALATVHDWELHLCDVDNAFLNAPLTEEVYLRQPKGLEDGTGRVYRLRKALYGLKQAPREWNAELGRHLEQHGFTRSHSDDALYLLKYHGGFCFVPTWVDDLLLVSNNLQGIERAKKILLQGFKLKDLGEVSLYLGMQVRRDRKRGILEVGLQRYAQGLQQKFQEQLVGVKSAKTPMSPDILSKIRNGPWGTAEQVPVGQQLYMSIVGSLMFAVTTCRPDLAFTVSTLAQANSSPNALYMSAAVRALRYFIDTAGYVLRYSREKGAEVQGISTPLVHQSPVKGYCDADWGGEADGRSRTAYVFLAAGGAITWSTKTLNSIADSTCVAEYKAASLAAKEAIWLRQLLGEIEASTAPILIFCDNQSAIKIAKNPCEHQRTKHVTIAWHTVRQAIADGDVLLQYISTHLQVADLLTKSLDGPMHKANRELLGLHPATLQG